MALPTRETFQKQNEMVQVVMRCRPISNKETLLGYVSAVRIDPLKHAVEIYDPKFNHWKIFFFDKTYDFECTNEELYNNSVQPLVNAVLNGFNATVFAYGQSGAGKTFTMEGDDCDTGVIPKVFEGMFDIILNSYNREYLIRVSYLEIYQDEIRDLLVKSNSNKCELRESSELGVYVKNLSSFVCENLRQMEKILNTGRLNRAVGVTDLNERSSRSHAILTITVETRSTESPAGSGIRVGKLNLVDLAGSERQNKTNAEGKRLREATKINLSLTALGNVISALSENKRHIPYRDSKLTRLLRNSLGGNSKTLMIANIGPANCNFDESLNTLRFASRARNIQNQPRVNEDPYDTLLRKYQEQIEKLKSQLAEREANKTKHRLKKQNVKILNSNQLSVLTGENSQSNKITEGIKTFPEIFYEEEVTFDPKTDQKLVDDLVKRIQLMESKLLTGYNKKSLLEHTCDQKKYIEAQNNEIQEIKQREKEIQELIVLNEETACEIQEDFSSLQQEVESQSKTLLKLYNKYKNIQQEIYDVKEDFNQDRREIENTKYEILKDYKLRLQIIENFVPDKVHRQAFSSLVFDEELDYWKTTQEHELHQITSRPKSADHVRRPVTLFTQVTRRKAYHIYRCNRTLENQERTFRFKGENILELELYRSPCTTKDFKSIKLPSKLKNDFRVEDITIDARNSSFYKRTTKNIGRLSKHTNDNITTIKPVYPKSRGLVPK